MRKNVLALGIAAMLGGLGFAGAASAGVIAGTSTPTATTLGASNASSFTVSQGGVGHQLIVPYFTTQSGNMSVVHIVNTDTANGKALKVRFRGASNSDDIMDLQVLLSPGDVWTASVAQGSDGISTLTTYDNTCTYPKLSKGVAQPFVTSRLNPNLTTAQIAENTREGYVEIFNMADIPSAAVYTVGSTTNTKSALYNTIKHVATTETPACDSTVLDATLLTNYTVEASAAAVGFAAPTGGLLGDWYIINTGNTTVFSGSDTALTAVNAGASARGNFVFHPQLASAVASPELFTADPALASATKAVTAKTSLGAGTATAAAVISAAYYDLPDLSTPYLTTTTTGDLTGPRKQAATLTGQLAVASITNEYARDPSIAAQTDWVFSMPTRRYSVALDYSTTTNGVSTPTPVYSYVGAGNDGGTTTIPAAAPSQYFSKDNTKVVSGQICVNADGQSFWSREESVASAAAVFSPSQLTTYRFCGETSVLSFSTTSPLGANLARQTTTSGYTNGWGVVTTNNATGTAAQLGLPILGSSFIKLSNTAVTPNVNYGLTLPHRFVSASGS